MAGMWIPWEVGLCKKSEILQIAKICNVHPHMIAARCMMVWEWAQDQTVDGIIRNLTPADVSFAVGVDGLGEAMAQVEWIADLGDAISFPNWDKFNGEPAKKRADVALRKRRERRRKQAEEQAAKDELSQKT